MFYRDEDGNLTKTGHIGFVMRVALQDGKAVAINTIEGNAGNRVKIGRRKLTDDRIVGFINNFPENEQPAEWETGLVRSTSAATLSTRSLTRQLPENVKDLHEEYQVVDQQNVSLNIWFGGAQIGVSIVFLEDTELGRGDIVNLKVGSGEKIRGKMLKIKSVVTDVNDLSNHTSITYSLSGGAENQSFLSQAVVAEHGNSIVYRAIFTLV
jgi:hypothetical protein